MKKKKGKGKKGSGGFALTPKVNQDEDIIKQNQVNKKILQDKFCIVPLYNHLNRYSKDKSRRSSKEIHRS